MPPSSSPAPHHAWFPEARFGIFIHWGIYSVSGYEASWAFFNHGAKGQDPRDALSHARYMAQRHAFFAERYDPAAWMEVFARAGAKYAVLTTKHHDGVALWDTADGVSTVRDCGVGRDLVAPFCAAARAAGLRLGLYYSHLDWNHPDYPSIRKPDTAVGAHPGHRYAYPAEGVADDPVRWERFLRFHRLQLRELCERFSPDLLWFDGDWERTPEQWRMRDLRQQLLAWRPEVLINSRIGDEGDYDTPEQAIPLVPPPRMWELCLTMNRGWSIPLDPSYKSARELVRVLCECAGMGGNLLLNVSPLADGSLWREQVEILDRIGAWMRVNGSAIHGTRAGLPHGCWYGPSTLSADRTRLHLIMPDRAWCEVAVKGIRNRIRSATILGGPDEQLPRRISGGAGWAGIPGTLWLTVPDAQCDPLGTVIQLDLEGPLDLYLGHGAVITQN